jgi:SulP family sulfate permease
MVKPAEVKQAFAQNRFHVVLIAYTAMMVILTDFLTGVLSVVIISGLLLSRVFDKPVESNEAAYELT